MAAEHAVHLLDSKTGALSQLTVEETTLLEVLKGVSAGNGESGKKQPLFMTKDSNRRQNPATRGHPNTS